MTVPDISESRTDISESRPDISESRPDFHESRLADLDPITLYRLLQLRTNVFVGEQGITVEPELDGLDVADDTLLLWIEDDGRLPASELRLLQVGGPVTFVGRVATRASARGRGFAGQLVRHATARARELGAEIVELHAQAHLSGWYASLGFEVLGEPFDEAGIPHVRMRWRPLLDAADVR